MFLHIIMVSYQCSRFTSWVIWSRFTLQFQQLQAQICCPLTLTWMIWRSNLAKFNIIHKKGTCYKHMIPRMTRSCIWNWILSLCWWLSEIIMTYCLNNSIKMNICLTHSTTMLREEISLSVQKNPCIKVNSYHIFTSRKQDLEGFY